MPVIRIKRVYDPAGPRDGRRVLVDRLWPRGIKKEALRLDDWLKEVAPSDSLRKWFAHDSKKWEEFQRRYHAELDRRPGVWRPLLVASGKGTVTLLFSAKDETRNNAVALKSYLEKQAKRAT